MGHRIRAVIAAPAVIERLAGMAQCPPPKNLPQGFALAALGDDQIDALTSLAPADCPLGFDDMPKRLKTALSALSGTGSLTYVETDYFGGAGSQVAAVFSQGCMIMCASIPLGLEPAGPDSPINAALRALGVTATAGTDEFDTLGLGRFRSFEALGIQDRSDD